MPPVRDEDIDELALKLWDAFRPKPITMDRYGRPNPVVVKALARKLLEAAEAEGIEDPLHEIDWLSILDPNLSASENFRKFLEWLDAHVGKKKSVSDELDRYITELEKQLRWLREQLRTAPPEERAGIAEEIKRIEAELNKVLKAKRPRERKASPPKKPAPKVPPPVKKPTKVSELPVDIARFRIERYLREKAPRTYRFDWTDLKVRISHHRQVTDALKEAVEAVGGKVVSVTPAKPPLVIMVADFSDASLPPTTPLPPDFEKTLLWSKFSAILISRGVADPTEYAEDFESVLTELEGRPFEEKQSAIEKLAVSVAPPKPPVAVPPDIMELINSLRREIDELRKEIAWRPKSAEEVRMVFEGILLTEPALMIRYDENGHPYWGPTDETLQALAAVLDRWALKYFTSCPVCRSRLPGGGLKPVDFVEHLIEVEKAVPPAAVGWLRRYAKLVEEAEKGGGKKE
jgi:hypothetical protein